MPDPAGQAPPLSETDGLTSWLFGALHRYATGTDDDPHPFELTRRDAARILTVRSALAAERAKNGDLREALEWFRSEHAKEFRHVDSPQFQWERSRCQTCKHLAAISDPSQQP